MSLLLMKVSGYNSAGKKNILASSETLTVICVFGLHKMLRCPWLCPQPHWKVTALFTLPSASSCLTRNSKNLRELSNGPKLVWMSGGSVYMVHGCRTIS